MDEEKFIRSEKYYKTILDNIKEHIIHVDTTGKILFANHATEIITHKKPNEAVGFYLQDYIVSPSKDMFISALQKVMDTKETYELNIAYQYKIHGNLVWYETVLTPLIDDITPGIIVISRDITVMKKLENNLQRKKEKLDIASDALQSAFHEMGRISKEQ